VKHGQSGGGVYDNDGCLIGIVSGYDDQSRLVYAPMSEVRKVCLREWRCFWGRCKPRQCPPPLPDQPVPPPPPLEVQPPPIPGPPGKDGRDGRDADAAAINAVKIEIAGLKAELERLRYTQIPLQILNADGSVYDEVFVRLDKRIPYGDPRLKNSADMKIRLPPDLFLKKDGASAGPQR
jgi:hypothetical protein